AGAREPEPRAVRDELEPAEGEARVLPPAAPAAGERGGRLVARHEAAVLEREERPPPALCVDVLLEVARREDEEHARPRSARELAFEEQQLLRGRVGVDAAVHHGDTRRERALERVGEELALAHAPAPHERVAEDEDPLLGGGGQRRIRPAEARLVVLDPDVEGGPREALAQARR